MPVKTLSSDSPPPPPRRTAQGTELGVAPVPAALETLPPPPVFSSRTVLKHCPTCQLNSAFPEDGNYCPTCQTKLMLVESGPTIIVAKDIPTTPVATRPTAPAAFKPPPQGRSPGPGTVMRVMGELKAVDREGRILGLFLLGLVIVGAIIYLCLRVPGH